MRQVAEKRTEHETQGTKNRENGVIWRRNTIVVARGAVEVVWEGTVRTKGASLKHSYAGRQRHEEDTPAGERFFCDMVTRDLEVLGAGKPCGVAVCECGRHFARRKPWCA
ncbi:hypothetical protein TRVL_06914 [Trypanosoma vivax]|nr:hypothetical protein TRVL_06914 [Trypanosoma vivax]